MEEGIKQVYENEELFLSIHDVSCVLKYPLQSACFPTRCQEQPVTEEDDAEADDYCSWLKRAHEHEHHESQQPRERVARLGTLTVRHVRLISHSYADLDFNLRHGNECHTKVLPLSRGKCPVIGIHLGAKRFLRKGS